MDYVHFFHSFQFYSTEAWFAFAVPSPQPLLICTVKVMNHSCGQLICMLITANPDALYFFNTLHPKTTHKIYNVLNLLLPSNKHTLFCKFTENFMKTYNSLIPIYKQSIGKPLAKKVVKQTKKASLNIRKRFAWKDSKGLFSLWPLNKITLSAPFKVALPLF